MRWKLNATAQQEDARGMLDVMTGGSAGGLTAALVAQIMLYDLAGRKGDLYRALGQRHDPDNPDKTDMPLNALFSKKLCKILCINMWCTRRPRSRKPGVFCAECPAAQPFIKQHALY